MGVEQHTGRMRARALARDGQAKARRPYYFEVDNSLSGKFKSFGWMTGFEPATTGTTNRGSTAELHPPYQILFRPERDSNPRPTA